MNENYDDAYIMIDAANRLADTLEREPHHHGDSVTARQLAEYIERTLIPIESRRHSPREGGLAMENTYIIVCHNEIEHRPAIYNPAIHGTSVKVYATLQECQAVCDLLNGEQEEES